MANTAKDILLEKALHSASTGSGSGRSEREGISLVELFEMFPDDNTAEAWFESILWKDGRPCPYCGNADTVSTGHKPTVPYRCAQCHSHFSVKTGTVMHRSKLGYQKWAIAIYMFATSLKGVSSMKLHRDLYITQKSAWFMGQRIREAWSIIVGTQVVGEKMQGSVEIDELYVGGREKNKHNYKKYTSKNTVVVCVKDRDANKISAQAIPENTKACLEDFVERHVSDTTTKYTDENPSYIGLENHHTVNHSIGEYVRGQIHTNGMESFWALRRGHTGIYYKMSPEHLDRYVNEFAGRHNIRDLDTCRMMSEITSDMSGKRLTYKCLIKNGVYAHKMQLLMEMVNLEQ